MNKKNKLERNLARQLKQAGFSFNKLPTGLDEWRAFLMAVNRSYAGNRETRYLLEKSLDESSREMRKLYDDLKAESEQRIKALQESEEKSRFMANMSHEIRTPIHGILGSLEIVKNNSTLDSKQKAFVSTAFSSAESLLDIINNILDFSKISADQLELENISFDLYQLVDDVNNIALMTANDKHIEINCVIDKNVPSRYIGDPTKIRQILTNLLSNAIKFTEQGSVSTHVKLLNQDKNSSKIRIEVKDTGIGISEAMQKNIFEAFIQEDASTTRQYGGTGLGLTIVKELVDLMDGEIQVESHKSQGSTFIVDIILQNVDDIKDDTANSALSGLRVLAVDDIKANRTILEHYLMQWDIHVDLAESATEGLQHLMQSKAAGLPYDIVIVDWFMPGMDGLKFSQTLNNEEEFKHIPKIMLSSSTIGRSERMQANLAISLTKPIRKAMLKDVLLECVNIIEERTKSKKWKDLSKKRHTKNNQQYHLDNNHLTLLPEPTDILLAEDNEVNALIAVTMIEQMGLTVKHVTDGKQAVEEVKKGRYRTVLMDMHMPVMDGYEATKTIRHWELETQNTEIPIIALTANALIGDRAKCLATGMNDYLPKPVKQERLKEVIAQWVNGEANAIVA